MVARVGLGVLILFALGGVSARRPLEQSEDSKDGTTYLLSINLSGPFNCIESLAETAIVAKSMGFTLVSPTIPEHLTAHEVVGAVGHPVRDDGGSKYEDLFDLSSMQNYVNTVTLEELARLGWDGKVQASVVETKFKHKNRAAFQALAQRIRFGPDSALTVDLEGSPELHLDGCTSIALPCFQELRNTLLGLPAPGGIRVIVSHLFYNFMTPHTQIKEEEGQYVLPVRATDDGRFICRTTSKEAIEPMDILSCLPSPERLEGIQSSRIFPPEYHEHWSSFFRSLRHTGRLLDIIYDFQTWLSERDPGAKMLPDKPWPATLGEERPSPRARYALIHMRPSDDHCVKEVWLKPGFDPTIPGAEALEARYHDVCVPNVRQLLLAARIMRVRLRQEGLTTLVLMCRPDLYQVAKRMLKDIAKDGVNIVTLGDYLDDPLLPRDKVEMSMLEQVTVEMEIALQAEVLTCGIHSSISSAIVSSRSAYGLPAANTVSCAAMHAETI